MICAFIIIDMQEDFFKDSPILSRKKAILVKRINDLVFICRNKEIPIIWVSQEFEENLSDAPLVMRKNNIKKTIKGTEGCIILSSLNKNEHDYIIIKKRYSAFYNTKLEETLKNLNIDTIILAGINTHACVRTTAVDAYQRDYNMILAKECIESYDNFFHKESMRYLTGYIAKGMLNKEIQSELIRIK